MLVSALTVGPAAPKVFAAVEANAAVPATLAKVRLDNFFPIKRLLLIGFENH
jgi:hypothetical protein